MKIVQGRYLGPFTCAQCGTLRNFEKGDVDYAFVIMGEATVCWQCLCDETVHASDAMHKAS